MNFPMDMHANLQMHVHTCAHTPAQSIWMKSVLDSLALFILVARQPIFQTTKFPLFLKLSLDY